MSTVLVERCARVEIDMLSNDERSMITQVWGDSTGAPDANEGCFNLAQAIINNVLDPLKDCISSDTEITGIRVYGVSPGFIPYSESFASGSLPGTRAAGTTPNQVAALAYYLPDAFDNFGARLREAKDFIPGLANADIVKDLLVAGVKAAIAAFVGIIVAGIVDATGDAWHRIIGPLPSDPSKRMAAAQGGVRGSVKTQKRRLLPTQ